MDLNLRGIEISVFLEDQHFGMIVKSEGFFCRLIVDDDRSKRWISFKDGNQIESKPALEISWFGFTVTPDDILVGRGNRSVHGNIKW